MRVCAPRKGPEVGSRFSPDGVVTGGLCTKTFLCPCMPWLKTRPMADAAGCSERTLKRNMDVRGGCLNLGEHYRHGPSANASYLWRADLVIEALSHRGMVAAEGRKLLLELTASEQKN